MKTNYLIFLFLFIPAIIFSQKTFKKSASQVSKVDATKVKEDFKELLKNIKSYYSYLNTDNVDLICIKKQYSKQIKTLKTSQDVLLFFEHILMEFYDNHFILNTNNNKSYRTSAPIYLTYKNDKFIVKNVWSSQIKGLNTNILKAEVLSINNKDFLKEIQDFPVQCANKKAIKVKEWIANKIIFGTYNKPRILQLKLSNNSIFNLDLDKIVTKKTTSLLDVNIIDNIGIIKINNSLGNNNLVKEFDNTLDLLSSTKATILDLRNTLNGGNTYVAKGIMSRFINEEKPYQKHSLLESYNSGPKIKRTFVEYVTPRGKHYNKPLIVLVGRWTGSMGEGLAIGFDGLQRATIVGTEMRKLLGAVYTIPFKNFSYKYTMPAEKLFHINNTPRENFIPKNYVYQTDINTDKFMKEAIQLLSKK